MRYPSLSRLFVGGLAIQLALSGILGLAVVFAAGLGVTTQKLTVSSGPTSVPLTTCTLEAAADAYVDELNPEDNFGGATTLDVQSELQEGILILPDEPANKRTLVRFNVASCVPAGASVQSASMRLFMESAPSASRTYQVHRVNASSPPWHESTLTWDGANAIGVAASITDQTATGTAGNVPLQWAVTADVQAFASGTTNNGWQISDANENSETQQLAVFTSKDSTNANPKPTLVITYYP